jgi:hypothetical protein
MNKQMLAPTAKENNSRQRQRGTLRIYGGLAGVATALTAIFTTPMSSAVFGVVALAGIGALFASAAGFDARDKKPVRRSLGKFLPPTNSPRDLIRQKSVRSTVVFIGLSDEYGAFAVENLGEVQ